MDELAAAGGAPDLGGLHDVGELYAQRTGRRRPLASWRPAPSPAWARPVPATRRRCCGPARSSASASTTPTTSRRAGPSPGADRPFAKFSSCLIAHGEPIIRPAITSELDYEGELAVIIGRRATDVAVGDALGYVGGYTIINDVSARDLQSAEPQWIRGKALDTFAPLGPVVLDAAAAPPSAR